MQKSHFLPRFPISELSCHNYIFRRFYPKTNTKTKLILSLAVVITLLVISIIVTIVFTSRPQTETTEVSGSVLQTSETTETESTFYHYETNETDVIKDIKIIPIGD